jgi:hypothetical protein
LGKVKEGAGRIAPLDEIAPWREQEVPTKAAAIIVSRRVKIFRNKRDQVIRIPREFELAYENANPFQRFLKV